MGDLEPIPWTDAVEERLEFLERLAEDPADKPQLEEDLDPSRSTIDRAIRQLEAADLVERTDRGYTTTPTGRVAADRYRGYLEDQRSIDDAKPILSVLPVECAVPTDIVVGGEAHPAEGQPHRTFERVARHLRTADRYRAVLPTLADSRHFRLLHARVVEDGLDVDLVVGHDLADRLREEFPGLLADLQDATSCTVRRGDVHPYGLVLASTAEETTAVLSTYRDGRLAGTIENDDRSAVGRAEEIFTSVVEETESVALPHNPPEEDVAPAVPGSRRRVLADAGAVRLDRDSFLEGMPNDPEAAWRLGFEPIDVYYGYAVQRTDPSLSGSGSTTVDDRGDDPSGEPVVAAVLADRLAAHQHQLVLGPPGSGKSTLCQQVTCRWIEADRGPVFYREPGATAADLSGLADTVTATDGHALVVVEDVPDVTESFLSFLRLVRDESSVTVLGEARQGAFQGAFEEITDPRLREVARTSLHRYYMPSVDEGTCRRAITTFEAATGREVPLSPSDLLERARNEGGIGEMFVLGYQVVTHAVSVPWLDDPVGPSVLMSDVRDVYQTLTRDSSVDDGSLALEVGFLVATLTAVEKPVTPGLVHAIAAARDENQHGHDDRHRDVEAVLDDLDGRMLIDREQGTAYRTQHPLWARRFLEHAVEQAERETVRAFERAINAVLTLADDPERRERIERWLGWESRTVRQMADPEVVDEYVETVFGLALDDSALAPLFGTSEHSGIEIPETASTAAHLEAASCRGNSWYDYGDIERAETELTWLLGRAREVDDEWSRTLYVAEAGWALGELVIDRGDTESARNYLTTAREAARNGSHTKREVAALNSLAWVAMTVEEYDRAGGRLDEALSIVEELGVCGAHADTLYYHARLARYRGDLENAEHLLERTVEMDRELENRSSASTSLKQLADVAKEREAYDRAEQYYRRSLEVKREVTDRQGLARTLYDYGDLQLSRSAIGDAEEAFERSLELAGDLELRRLEGRVHYGLAGVALSKGDDDTAERHVREGRRIHEEVDHDRGLAAADARLGDVARERDDLDTARQHYRDSVVSYRRIDATGEALEVLENLVETCRDADDESSAVEWCDTGETLATDDGRDDWTETFARRRETLVRHEEQDD